MSIRVWRRSLVLCCALVITSVFADPAAAQQVPVVSESQAQQSSGPGFLGIAVSGMCGVGACPPAASQPSNSESQSVVTVPVSFDVPSVNGDRFRIAGVDRQSNHNCGDEGTAQVSIQYLGNNSGTASQADNLTLEVFRSFVCKQTNPSITFAPSWSFSSTIAPGSSADFTADGSPPVDIGPSSAPKAFGGEQATKLTVSGGAVQWHNTYSLIFAAGSPAGSYIRLNGAPAPPQPLAARVASVGFGASAPPVLRDLSCTPNQKCWTDNAAGLPQPETSDGLHPCTVTESDPGDEWQDCPGGHKEWPVVASFDSTGPPQPNVDEVVLAVISGSAEGLPVTGTDSADGLTFAGTLHQAHNMAIARGLDVSGELPGAVDRRTMTITWTIDNHGVTVPAGTSKQLIYVARRSNDVTYDPAQRYLSIIDLATSAAIGHSDELLIVHAIWNQFKSLHLTRAEVDSEQGTVHPGAVLHYWPSWMLKDDFDNTYVVPQCGQDPLILLSSRDTTGKCGIWAAFFIDVLAAEGIKADFVTVAEDPQFQRLTPRQFMLIADWDFDGPATGDVDYPFVDTAHSQEFTYRGTPAQGHEGGPTDSPLGYFHWGDHAVVRYGGEIWDPSYAVGPFDNILDWARHSIVGYAMSIPTVGVLTELRANRATAADLTPPAEPPADSAPPDSPPGDPDQPPVVDEA